MQNPQTSAEDLVALLRQKKRYLATAESCTGGMLSAAITAVPGSSGCFSYGVVTYADEAKEKILQVPPQTLTVFGAVSAQTACAMAQGMLDLASADIALAITGIAGPDGGNEEKPVGLVFVGLATAKTVVAFRFQFNGGRGEVRRQTVDKALFLLTEAVKGDGFFEKED